MSEALYEIGGLRFWSEDEIERRDAFARRMASTVRDTLTRINPAWSFWRVEGPCLSPRNQISAAYDDNDIFVTNHEAGGAPLCLRAETTPSSYAYARWLAKRDKRARFPLCVWQAAKSFRRETNDGASAAKLRFNEFYQLEFQCLYSFSTQADYQTPVMAAAEKLITRETGRPTRIIPSDRLPAYSLTTLDIEVALDDGATWREMASCSIRTDYADDVRVLELAIGLDRVVEVAGA